MEFTRDIKGSVVMKQLRALYQRVGYTVSSFVLALSMVTAAVPFILSSDAGAVAGTHADLQDAIDNAPSDGSGVINLTGSVTLGAQVTVNKPLTINGNNNTIYAAFSKTSNSNNAALGIQSNNVVINNLNIARTSGNALHGVNIYNSHNVTLNNVSVSGFNTWVSPPSLWPPSLGNPAYGMVINGSGVTLSGVVSTLNNNSLGAGVNVDNGSTLTVLGQHINSGGLGAVYVEDGSLDDSNSQYIGSAGIYILKSAPAAPTFVSPTPANGATISDNSNIVVSWNKPSYASTFEYRINGGVPISTSTQSFAQNFANGDYTVEVRSVAASGLLGDWSSPRSFTVGVYDYAVNDSKFVGSPQYVQANGAHNSHNTSAEVHVPKMASEVQFFVDGDGPVAGYRENSVNASTDRWRLKTNLAAGEYTITAKYSVNGILYDVTGSGVAYSIDAPTAQYVSPSDTSYTFRSSDNPVRLRVEDQYEQFRRMVVTIKDSSSASVGSYEVLRSDCDSRQAGRYLLCDVSDSSSWLGDLSEGVYTASTTTYTKANNRVDNLISREFTIDNSKPVVTSLSSPDLVANVLPASATATDGSGSVESVNFFVTEPRFDGACVSNGVKLAEQRIYSEEFGIYGASLDVSLLADGEYCLFAVSRDDASNNSTAVSRLITIDNTAPDITLKGEEFVTLTVGDEYNEEGVTVVDANSTTLAITGDVNTAVAGVYILTYIATDEAGNESNPVTRTVTVVEPAPEVIDEGTTTTDDDDEEGNSGDGEALFPAGFASIVDTNPDLTPDTEDAEDADQDVAGATTDNAAQVAGASDDASWLGLAWYWWVLIAAAVLGAGWWLAGAIRRRGADAEA